MDAQEILTALLTRCAGPAIPINVALWDTADLAEYLRMSTNRVRTDIVTLPTFPRAVRLTAKAQARYKAREVIQWAEAQS